MLPLSARSDVATLLNLTRLLNTNIVNDKNPDWKTSRECLFKTDATMDLQAPGL